MTDESLRLEHPELRRLYVFWCEQGTGGGVPLSSAMEPADLRDWLGHLLVMDVVASDEFAYAYYGRELAEAFGISRLGQTLEQLPPNQRAILRAEYDQVRGRRQPLARIYTADFDGHTQTWERLVLPLSSDGETVDKLLVAAYEL